MNTFTTSTSSMNNKDIFYRDLNVMTSFVRQGIYVL